MMIITNWIVFTGAPCSGKTTVLERLKEQGYRYIPEVARTYIETELAKGRDLKAIRENEGDFQRGLILTKAEIEDKLNPQEIVFLDRAMPDSISYYKLSGLDPTEVFELSNRYRYFKIFVFERLPIESDQARTESESERELLDSHLCSDYKSLGYEVISVPVMPVEERLEFIKQYLPNQ